MSDDTPEIRKPNELGLDKLPAEFSPHARIDPATGMYVMPEPKPNESAFTERADGIFLPVPTYKRMRYIRFESNQLEANETMEEIQSMVDDARSFDGAKWYTFTDPRYGTPFVIPRHALATCQSVIDAWIDLEAVQAQIEKIEYAKAQEKVQLFEAKAHMAKQNHYKRKHSN